MNLIPRTAFGAFTLLLRLFLGGLFVWAGWEKSRDPIRFLDSIRSFQIVGDPWAAWLAMGLPWLEVAAGVAVMTGLLLDGGLALIAGMLLTFLAALGYSWHRGLNPDCGCFGGDSTIEDFTGIIVRDAALLAIALFLLIARWRQARVGGTAPATA